MTQGIKALRRIQLGAESIAGTQVAATTLWRGTGTIQDNLEQVFPEEDIGILPGVDRSYIPKVEAMLSLSQTEATFQQLPYLFEMGIEHVTPTTDANSAGVWTYTMPIETTDVNVTTDLATYTIEGGDNAGVEYFTFAHARTINLSGDAGQGLMMSAELVGRQVTVASTDWTESVSIPTVSDVLFSKGKLYIDPVTSSTDLGQTQVSNAFLSMDLSITTGWTPVYTADGNLYFSFVKQVQPEVVLQITFEHNDNAIAEKAYWRAGTPRQIRVQFDGATGEQLLIDMAGKWDNFDAIGERDGNDIVTGTFRARYNSTCARFFSVAIYNASLAALP